METKAESTVAELESKLKTLQASHSKALMELGFLQKATAHLNFHENAHDGILYTDANDHVVYANPYFLEMIGIKDKETLLGKPIPEHFWQSSTDPEQLFKDVRQEGFVRERELRMNNLEDQPVFAMCSSVATRDENGQFAGTELMFCNITSKRKLQAELHIRTKQLERLFTFTQETVFNLSDMLRRNSSKEELAQLVKHLEQEFESAQKEAHLP